jgi:SAM-dependent methyltransferase
MRAGEDFLYRNLKDLPYFRALLRAVEARFYQGAELPDPILDVGCGDGHFASIAFQQPLALGVDPWEGPLKEAAGRNAYRDLVRADGARMPLPEGYFASAISNSVLEHIPNVQEVLAEVGRVLRPGAPFLFSVPNHRFDPGLSIARFFENLRLPGLADRYRSLFDRIARHQHLDDPETWQARLQQSGFRVARWWHYFSPAALRTLEWGHYFGLPSLLTRRLFGRWVLAPTRLNLWLPERLTRKHYEEPLAEDGVCTFFVAVREG